MKEISDQRMQRMGISIDFDGKDPIIHHNLNLSQLTIRELQYFFGSNVRFVEVQNESREKFLQKNKDTNQIITELETSISDEDFEKSAEIALSATTEIDAPLVKLFNNLLAVAISRSASDIHIDFSQKTLNIAMRFDGILTAYTSLDRRIAPMLISRIKLVSGMDITERRKPQDGRFSAVFEGRNVDIRVASIPVKAGERVALRLFNRDAAEFCLAGTGLAESHQVALREALARQNGLVLICGPTGSGKTTTIYSMLNALVGRGLNIMTIEDPVEVDLSGIVQTQVNESVGYSFSEGLRAILRNDPDVILVGEIRDEITASVAVRAAMTGHLVISTVHSNSPIGAIKRLVNLGVDKTLLAESLVGIFNQRLIKIYCENCRHESNTTNAHHSPLPETFKGCPVCFHTGFNARSPVMSHALISAEDRKTIELEPSLLKYMSSMSNEALEMHKAGLVPMFEVTKLAID